MTQRTRKRRGEVRQGIVQSHCVCSKQLGYIHPKPTQTQNMRAWKPQRRGLGLLGLCQSDAMTIERGHRTSSGLMGSVTQAGTCEAAAAAITPTALLAPAAWDRASNFSDHKALNTHIPQPCLVDIAAYAQIVHQSSENQDSYAGSVGSALQPNSQVGLPGAGWADTPLVEKSSTPLVVKRPPC